jgi:flagellar motor switch protein FliN/FliY
MDDLLSQDEINALLGGGSALPSSDLSIEDSQVLDEIAGIFSNAEGSVFGMLAGKDVNTAGGESVVVEGDEFKAKVGESPFIFRTTLGGFNDIPMLFAVERRGAMALADLMMGGEGKDLPEETSELYLNAAQEGLSQVVGSAFTRLSGLLGGRRLMPENTASALEASEWEVFPHLGGDKVWANSAAISIEGVDPFNMWVALPLDSVKLIVNAIRESMAPQEKQQAAPAAAPMPSAPMSSASMPPVSMPLPAAPSRGAQSPAPVVDVHPAEFTPLAPGSPPPGGSKIDLIADIPVRVTVELGKTRKNISEILAMTTGSVIELDKMAGEAVDVLVNGKLVAKGEVVVIDENFGVRITEVLNPASKTYA